MLELAVCSTSEEPAAMSHVSGVLRIALEVCHAGLRVPPAKLRPGHKCVLAVMALGACHTSTLGTLPRSLVQMLACGRSAPCVVRHSPCTRFMFRQGVDQAPVLAC